MEHDFLQHLILMSKKKTASVSALQNGVVIQKQMQCLAVISLFLKPVVSVSDIQAMAVCMK